ncbi:MAG: DUF1559 domain-containing protein [Gemmataceae bacterium]
MSSFKVQCPSCEAQVLIKNPNLVGSKVECPKCKYRFKVEAPADEPTKDAGKADKADKPDKKEKAAKEKKPKTAKGNNKKLIGIGLAVGAVALLGVGGYVMFGTDDKPKGTTAVTPPSQPRPAPQPDGSNPNPEEVKKEDEEPSKKPKEKAPPVLAAPRSDKESTNLLPTKSVAVYRFDMGRLRATPAGGMLLDPATADMVKSSLGLELGDIEHYYHCSVGDKERSAVGLIRLRLPADEKKLAAGIAGAGTGKVVGGKTLMPVKNNPLLSAAGNALAARTLFADVYTTPPAPPAKPAAFGVCVYDTQHVLVGEFAAIESHLAALRNGYPEFQTEVNKEAPPPEPEKKDGMPDTPMPKATPPAVASSAKAFTTNPRYLSLDPKLRLVLLTMLEDRTGEPPFVLAERFDEAQYPRKGVKKEYAPIAAAVDPVLTRTEHVGMNLVAFTPQQLVANVRFFTKSASDARLVALEKLTPTFGEGLPLVSLLLQTHVEFRNLADPNFVPSGAPGTTPEGGPMGSSSTPMGRPLPGTSGPPSSSSTPGPMGPPLTSGPPGVIGPPPGFGPMSSSTGQMPGPMSPMSPNQPTQGKQAPSFVALRLLDESVLVTVDITWPDEVFYRLLGPRLLGYVNQLKGKAAVYSGTETWHALGRAVKQYGTERKELPPGTVPVSRPNDHDTRLGVAYPPAQRVSFYVELLPALGRGGLRQLIDPSLGWLSNQNAAQAGSWVPELLVSYYPQSAWRATSPLAPDFTFGGTNFVAVAGVGHDAPRYNPKTNAKQAGVTGYDWGSKLADITDGPENTIYLLQTPPGAPRPWAAGGGATVVGLDPTNPMAAFKHTRPDGREGTYAVMADGTVRWLPADIKPEHLLAMATRAGGEKLPNLEEIAPRVLPSGAKAELTATAPSSPMPKSDAPLQVTPPTAPPPTPKVPVGKD